MKKKYFNKVSSYDREDCKKYGLYYLANFYFKTIIDKNVKIKVDVYTTMADIKRKEVLEKVAQDLKNKNISYNINLIIKNSDINSDLIKIEREYIPMEEMLSEMIQAKVILEILKKENKSSTLRAIECIGLKKKLITNNQSIVNEDFFDPNNILVINEENINISKEFVNSPYKELPKEILEKYNINTWIENLLKI